MRILLFALCRGNALTARDISDNFRTAPQQLLAEDQSITEGELEPTALVAHFT